MKRFPLPLILYCLLFALPALQAKPDDNAQQFDLTWKADTRKEALLYRLTSKRSTTIKEEGKEPSTIEGEFTQFVEITPDFDVHLLPFAEIELWGDKTVEVKPNDSMTLMDIGVFEDYQTNYVPDLEGNYALGLLFRHPAKPMRLMEERKDFIGILADGNKSAVSMRGDAIYKTEGMEKADTGDVLKLSKTFKMDSAKDEQSEFKGTVKWEASGTETIDPILGQIHKASLNLTVTITREKTVKSSVYSFKLEPLDAARKKVELKKEFVKAIEDLKKSVLDGDVDGFVKKLKADYFSDFEERYPQFRKQKDDDKLSVFANGFAEGRKKLQSAEDIKWKLVKKDNGDYTLVADCNFRRLQRMNIDVFTLNNTGGEWKVIELLGTHQRLVEFHLGSGELHKVED